MYNISGGLLLTLENRYRQIYAKVNCVEKQKKTHVQLVLTLLGLIFILNYVLKIETTVLLQPLFYDVPIFLD